MASLPNFNGTGSVYVCIRIKRSVLQCGPVLRYSVDLRIQTYREPVPLKYAKLATEYPWIYGYFAVYFCRVGRDTVYVYNSSINSSHLSICLS